MCSIECEECLRCGFKGKCTLGCPKLDGPWKYLKTEQGAATTANLISRPGHVQVRSKEEEKGAWNTPMVADGGLEVLPVSSPLPTAYAAVSPKYRSDDRMIGGSAQRLSRYGPQGQSWIDSRRYPIRSSEIRRRRCPPDPCPNSGRENRIKLPPIVERPADQRPYDDNADMKQKQQKQSLKILDRLTYRAPLPDAVQHNQISFTNTTTDNSPDTTAETTADQKPYDDNADMKQKQQNQSLKILDRLTYRAPLPDAVQHNQISFTNTTTDNSPDTTAETTADQRPYDDNADMKQKQQNQSLKILDRLTYRAPLPDAVQHNQISFTNTTTNDSPDTTAETAAEEPVKSPETTDETAEPADETASETAPETAPETEADATFVTASKGENFVEARTFVDEKARQWKCSGHKAAAVVVPREKIRLRYERRLSEKAYLAVKDKSKTITKAKKKQCWMDAGSRNSSREKGWRKYEQSRSEKAWQATQRQLQPAAPVKTKPDSPVKSSPRAPLAPKIVEVPVSKGKISRFCCPGEGSILILLRILLIIWLCTAFLGCHDLFLLGLPLFFLWFFLRACKKRKSSSSKRCTRMIMSGFPRQKVKTTYEQVISEEDWHDYKSGKLM